MLRPPFLSAFLLWIATGILCAEDVALIGVGEPWRFRTAVEEIPEAWRQVDFEDQDWRTGDSGFGASTWGENTLFGGLLRGSGAICFRKTFSVEDPATVRTLTLRCDWQGGFVAFLNGVEVARRDVPGIPGTPVPMDSLAAPRSAGVAEEIGIQDPRGILKAGTNVLAIQAHPHELGWLDVVLVPELLANFTRGPYLQGVIQDRATILWRTPAPAVGRVEYGSGGTFNRVVSDPVAARSHSVVLEGLEPGRRYFYRVWTGSEGEAAVSGTYSFRTLPSGGDLEFSVFGDSGAGSPAQFMVARQLARQPADLILHLGDVVYPMFAAGRADTRCLSVYRGLFRTTPFYATWGNHDLYAGTEAFLDVFRQPTNSTPSVDHINERTRPEFYYSFDAGDAHFAVLFWPYSSQYHMRAGCPQLQWLEADLAASPKPWKFLMLHHPVNTSGVHRFDDYDHNEIADRLEVSALLMPVAARHGVQMIFSGHDHNFERFHPVNGTHTVVSGGGGIILYKLSELDPNSARFESRWHFTSVSLKGDMLRMVAIDGEGRAFDALEFRRNPADSEDPDGDGLGSDAERTLGTRPDDSDTDGDGLPDGWEFLHRSDPRVAETTPAELRLAPFLAGRLPRPDAELAAHPSPAGGVELRWLQRPGTRAVVEESDRLEEGWVAVPPPPGGEPPDAGKQFLRLPAGAHLRFFRVRMSGE